MANPQELKKAAQPIGVGTDSILNEEVEALDRDIEIYTMPERFRYSNVQTKSSNKMGLVIIVVGGLLIIGLAVGMYFYFFSSPKQPAKKQAENSQPAAEQKQEPVVEQKAPEQPKESPKEAYLRLKREAPDPANSALAEDIGDIIEETSGNYSTLKAATKDGSKTGVVNMTLDNGSWRISSENWITIASETATSTPETATSTEVILKPGFDMDSDGLTDQEEILLATNANLADSDGDTYPDFAEFYKLYNPAGAGKLTDNKSIARYENKTFGYSLLYPSAWRYSAIDTDESVIIKSNDNQFIQVVAQANPTQALIEDWYKQTFGVMEVSADRMIAQAAWDGIKNDDNTMVYLTDKSRNRIYSITYNTGDTGILDYINFLNLAVYSFTLK